MSTPKTPTRRSFAAVAMRTRAQKAGPHKDKRAGRGNPRTEARRSWRGDAS